MKADNVIKSGKKLLFFVLMLAIVNVLVISFVGLAKTINVSNWEVTDVPQENSLYAYTYNASAGTGVTDPAAWSISLDTDGQPTFSAAYTDYTDTRTDLDSYTTKPLAIMNILLGGLLLLAVLLEIFGINVGSMMGGAAGKSRRSYN